MKLRELDKFDAAFDEHFSNDTSVKIGAANTGRQLSDQSREKIAESNRQTKLQNPLTQAQKRQIGDAMRGQTLEQLIGEEKAALGRIRRRTATKGLKRPVEVVEKIMATRRARGGYENSGMTGHTHKESTKIIQGQKAKIRQDLKRKLGLGRSDSVPQDLLEKAYKKHNLI